MPIGSPGSAFFVANKKEFTSFLDPEYDFSFYSNKYTGQENVIDYK